MGGEYKYVENIDANKFGKFVQVLEGIKKRDEIETKILFFDKETDWILEANKNKDILFEFDEDYFITSIKVLVGGEYVPAFPSDNIVKWETGGFSIIPFDYFNNE